MNNINNNNIINNIDNMMEFIAQKQSGEDSASEDEIQYFKNFCEKTGAETFNICVTDDEHEVLSLDAIVPFKASINNKLYNTVMEAYNDIIMENTISNIEKQSHTDFNLDLMYELNRNKFDQNIQAKKLLMSITTVIVYKTENDQYWGSSIPEFDGDNVAGEILLEISKQYNELENLYNNLLNLL